MHTMFLAAEEGPPTLSKETGKHNGSNAWSVSFRIVQGDTEQEKGAPDGRNNECERTSVKQAG